MIDKQPKIYTEKDLANLTKRAKLLEIVEDLEKRGAKVDMTKYPSNTLKYLRQAVLDAQKQLEPTPAPIVPPAPVKAPEPPKPIPPILKSSTPPPMPVITPKPVPAPAPKTAPVTPPAPVRAPTPAVAPAPVQAPKPVQAPPKPAVPKPKIDWRTLPESTPEQFVRKAYWKILEREPDAGGLQCYVSYIKGNMPREQVEGALKSSPEYAALQRRKQASK
ncbi:DUF4214 domain-containing protein [Sulfuricurvum sp.]|uniref:DUF4214 domain-containing protein n=1 Tax=Sulfuricurvum sp. TaxID=2025608 RepID=UPI00356A905E